jgi:hypothetical protein
MQYPLTKLIQKPTSAAHFCRPLLPPTSAAQIADDYIDMANPWSKIRYFYQSSSASHDFSQLCQAFESDFSVLSSSYDRAKEDLSADSYKGRGTNSSVVKTDALVSEYARQERQIIEFCLAKLVELHRIGIKGPRAVRTVIEEAAKVEWDEHPIS